MYNAAVTLRDYQVNLVIKTIMWKIKPLPLKTLSLQQTIIDIRGQSQTKNKHTLSITDNLVRL